MAEYYEEDKDFLIEFEPTVVHYEVVGKSDERKKRMILKKVLEYLYFFLPSFFSQPY